jgi:hypothetical protein
MPKESQVVRYVREAGEHAAEKYPRSSYSDIEAVITSRLDTAQAWALYRATIAPSDTAAHAWEVAGRTWDWAHARVAYREPRDSDDLANAYMTEPAEWGARIREIVDAPDKAQAPMAVAAVVRAWLAE